MAELSASRSDHCGEDQKPTQCGAGQDQKEDRHPAESLSPPLLRCHIAVAIALALALATLDSCAPRVFQPPLARSSPAPIVVAPTVPPSTAAPTVPPTAPSVTTAAVNPVRSLAVASRTLPFVDPSRPTVSKGSLVSPSRALTTIVWYPTAPGRWPVVIFAHGFEVGPVPYEHLCRAWAAAGYVVAAPLFPLTDAAVAGPNLDEGDLPNQTADVEFVARALVDPGSAVASKVDPTRIAIAGHSDGAETALDAAQTAPTFRAVIAMSGGPVGGSDVHHPPVLAIQGDADPINPPADGVAVYTQAAPPRYLLRLLGGGHLPPFDDTTPYQPIVERVTTDFLDRYLSGRASSTAVLLHDAGPPLATIEGSP